MKRIDPAAIAPALEILARGVGDLDPIKARLKAQHVETPSWACGGPSARVAAQEGAPRNAFEEMEDAGLVHTFTGIAPAVAVHVPWEKAGDFTALAAYAKEHGVRIGAIAATLAHDVGGSPASLIHEDAGVRRKALEHLLECIDIAKKVNAQRVILLSANGSSLPGTGDFRSRKRWLLDGLKAVYDAVPVSMRVLLGCNPFGLASGLGNAPDWGMSYALSLQLGERAQVAIDAGVNIEHIVAFLLDEGRLGGLRLCTATGATNAKCPRDWFLIYNEVVAAEGEPCAKTDVTSMIGPGAMAKSRIEGMIQSVIACQTAYAKALLVDRNVLRELQAADDTVAVEELLQDAYQTDVRPLLAQVRIEMGLDPDPLPAVRASGCLETIRLGRSCTCEAGLSSGYPG